MAGHARGGEHSAEHDRDGNDNGGRHDHSGDDEGIIERALFWLALASYVWLVGGLIAYFATGGGA